jgi:hypothetical protein
LAIEVARMREPWIVRLTLVAVVLVFVAVRSWWR